MKPCPKCNGTKIQPAITLDGKEVYAARACYNCDGVGDFDTPLKDYDAIRALIVNPKTRKLFSTSLHSQAGRKRIAQSLRAGWSPRSDEKTLHRRAQYIWRMAIWHSGTQGSNLGGAIMADMDLGRDPYREELDGLADKICEECYGRGSSFNSARRWGKALYG